MGCCVSSNARVQPNKNSAQETAASVAPRSKGTVVDANPESEPSPAYAERPSLPLPEIKSHYNNKENAASGLASPLGSLDALGPPSGRVDPTEGRSPLHPKPIQFIKTTLAGPSRTFEVTSEATELLQGINKNVSVIGIAGTYRHGKSFLMNQLFGTQSGFELGPLAEGKTRGSYLWAFEQADKDEVLLLLDFEGLKDTENNTAAYDLQLFSLAVLLSSCLIYNQIGSVLDAAQIQDLSFIIDLTKHLRTKSGEETGADFDKHFPSLIWVMRDSVLEHVSIDGKEQTDDEYFAKQMKEEPGFSQDVDNRNRVRRLIKTAFKRHYFRRLPRPIHKEKALRYIDKARPEQIRSLWYTLMDSLRELVFSVTGPKELFSSATDTVTKVNGPAFLLMTESYITAFNRGDVPNISNTWDVLCENTRNKAQAEALLKYTELMSSHVLPKFPVDMDTLFENHSAFQEQAIGRFCEVIIGTDIETHVNKLKGLLAQYDEEGVLISGEYHRYVEMNRSKSREHCDVIQARICAALETKISKKAFASYAKYEAAVEAALKEYDTLSVGPMAMTVRETLQQTLARGSEMQALHFKLDEAGKVAAREVMERQRLEANFMKMRLDNDQREKGHRDQLRQHIAANAALEERLVREHRLWVQKHQEDLDERERKWKKALENRDAQAEMHRTQFEDLKREMERMNHIRQMEFEEIRARPVPQITFEQSLPRWGVCQARLGRGSTRPGEPCGRGRPCQYHG
ncbi:guanylate-binding protein [Fimicolochytrium jonesii]|uniref:guanylate-binding protein n=1 Tax=Fimicolochytrium jonesii TaxID=1396493 RepID=UPI0022FEDEF2|nr:guanylate-binding protein [Fimicolochytrium jonesii]KAI8817501.1 guanylate-binding protein [Fimicolochytrium jonesii]